MIKPAPMWLKNISIATTTLVGCAFYGVGLYDSNSTLIESGIVLIIVGLVCLVLVNIPDEP